MGGSFNPPHIGHLYLAELALSEAGYDRVILIPAYISPFKPDAEGALARDRLDMLAAAIDGEIALALDDCEIRREGVSYTIDTVDDIIRRYRPEGKPGLLLGDDLARNFPNWRAAREITERTDIVITRRAPSAARRKDDAALPPIRPEEFPFPATFIENAILDVSSREIRRRIAVEGGGPWRFFVPEGARRIIEDRRLYGYRPSGGAVNGSVADGEQAATSWEGGTGLRGREGLSALAARVAAAARAMLQPSRFLHSRGTALVAVDLARHFGVDPEAAYLAGIAHDMAKELSGSEMKRLAKKDGGSFSVLEKKKPSLLHGRAAASLLQERFGVEDEAVLEAVRLHTCGGAGMGDLAKIVYIADKTEPGRPRIAAELRAWEHFGSLDAYFTLVLQETVAYLAAKKSEISPGTIRLLEAMQKTETL